MSIRMLRAISLAAVIAIQECFSQEPPLGPQPPQAGSLWGLKMRRRLRSTFQWTPPPFLGVFRIQGTGFQLHGTWGGYPSLSYLYGSRDAHI